jgi:hypothetical protein
LPDLKQRLRLFVCARPKFQQPKGLVFHQWTECLHDSSFERHAATSASTGRELKISWPVLMTLDLHPECQGHANVNSDSYYREQQRDQQACRATGERTRNCQSDHHSDRDDEAPTLGLPPNIEDFLSSATTQMNSDLSFLSV